MKNLSRYFTGIVVLLFLMPQNPKAQQNPPFYPPSCLYVDPVSLEATWCKPLITALDEDFEDPEFPPAGWQKIPEEGGWYRTDSSTGCLTIPDWSSFYAISCGTPVGSSNFLITPPMDLRESEGYELTFDSYYDGFSGALAFINWSTDGGDTWETYWQMMPYPGWEMLTIGLEAFCGPDGPEQVMFSFQAQNADGTAIWAIDNVLIQVPYPPADYLDFYVYLNDEIIDTTMETTCNFDRLVYGQSYTAGVKAHYTDGLSEGDYYVFTSEYLIPPDSLLASAPDDAAILSWYPPSDTCCPPSGQLPLGLLGYNIYKDQEILAYTPHDPPGVYTPQGFVEEGIIPGWHEYTVTAVYDLTPYGYPGDTAESVSDGPAVISIGYCFELDFTESWDAGTFEDNFWITEGENWTISSTQGHPAPAAKFAWNPVQDNYALALESYCLTALGMTEGKIWLDFDLRLTTNFPPSGLENMNVQVWNWNDESWITVAGYSNADGSFGWAPKHIDITSEIMNSVFKVRFLAEGCHSSDITGWNIDNIHIYRTCGAPYGLYSLEYPQAIELYWEMPADRDLVSCNVYRNINDNGYELIANVMEIPFRQEGLTGGDMYCFKVTAIWQSDTDLCESDFSNEDCSTVSIESLNTETGFNIYPNPASDHLVVIPGKVKADKEISISLYNSMGVLLFENEYNMLIGEVRLNLEGYPSGIYRIKVSTDNKVEGESKFVISR
ncbi:MAG: T9SS type A sorting domain-containing protein [Bacteroidales bacterium]|jgi:hypothetical protein|nr:T9SS type A sorting domain-containing protein [Bacteroidales bacterium]